MGIIGRSGYAAQVLLVVVNNRKIVHTDKYFSLILCLFLFIR